MTKEIWKEIKGYEGLYSISSHGRVQREYSLASAKKGHILKPFKNIWGYYQVALYKNNKRIVPTIHKLVTLSFLGERPFKKQINHKDGVKKNNRLNNLEYLTCSQNNTHAFRTGLRKNKLKYKQVISIRKQYAKGNITQKELSRKYLIAESNICLIIQNKKWRDF